LTIEPLGRVDPRQSLAQLEEMVRIAVSSGTTGSQPHHERVIRF
jgi:hypothetical protein